MKKLIALISLTSLGQLISLLITPLIIIKLSPEDFGRYTFLLSLITIFSSVTTLRLDVAVLANSKSKSKMNLSLALASSIHLQLLTILGLILIIICLLDKIPFIDGILLFLGTLFTGARLIYIAFLNGQKEYSRLGVNNLIRFAGPASLQAILIILSFKSYIMLALALNVILFLIVIKFPFSMIQLRPVNILRRATKSLSFGDYFLYNFPSQIVSVIQLNITPVLLAYFFGSFEIGIFSIIIKLAVTPLSFIGRTIYQVVFKKSVDELDNRMRLNLFLKVSVLLVLLSLGYFASLKMVMSYFNSYIPKEWINVITYLPVLVLFSISKTTTSTTSYVFYVLERQDIILKVNLVGLLLLGISFFPFSTIGFQDWLVNYSYIFSAFYLVVWLVMLKLLYVEGFA